MKRFFIIIFYLLSIAGLRAQTEGVSINSTGNDPAASAILDIQSTEKGMLVPRMTTAQRNDISSPATSLLVFDTDLNSFWFYNGSVWEELSPSSSDEQSLGLTADSLLITGGSGLAIDSLEAWLFAKSGPGNPTADVIQDAYNASSVGNYIWQSWTSTQDAYMSEFQFQVFNIPFDGGYASIYLGEGTNGGNLIETVQVEAHSTGWATVSFDELDIELESAQQYTIRLADTVNSFSWTANNSNPYPDGRASGGNSSWDFTFRVYVKTAVENQKKLISSSSGSTWNLQHIDTLTANAFIGDGSGLTNVPDDDLGNHTATQALNLDGNNISNGGTVSASAFIGDGSGLTNIPGDDLGSHAATQTLDLDGNDLNNGGTVTASTFVGDGSGLTNLPVTDEQSLALSFDSLLINNGTGIALASLENQLFSNQTIGASVVDVDQPNGGSYIFAQNNGWQSWTSTQQAYLDEIHFRVNGSVPFDGGYASIYTGEGAIAVNLIKTFPIESHAGGWDTLSFDGLNILLEASNQYTIHIRDTVNSFAWVLPLVDAYAGGRSNYSTGTRDYAFRVVIKPISTQGLILEGNNSSWNLQNIDTVFASAFMGDGSGLTNVPGDNLGNHTATQNLQLSGYWLSNDGDDEGIRVENDGDVVIGSTSGSGDALLHVRSSVSQASGGNPAYGIRLTTGSSNSEIYHTAESDLVISKANQSNQLVLDAGGNIGLGTTEPEVDLDISKETPELRFTDNRGNVVDNDELGRITWHSTDNSGDSSHNVAFIKVFSDNGSGAAPDGRMEISTVFNSAGVATENVGITIMPNGRVGIGTTNPQYRLQVGESGDGSEARANSWNTFSDSTLKRDFAELPNVIQKLRQINGYTYYWKEGTADTTRQVGVMAQEIQRVLPEAVSTDAEGILSVGYGKLTALLIEVNQAQQDQIEALEKEKATQQAEMDILKAQIEQLQSLEARLQALEASIPR